MPRPLSIIIPAHNEEKVLAATLTPLLAGVADGSVEVVVVCNGCNDRSAAIVASLHPAIICLETPVASKAHALNLGDAKAQWFPRIYQDADVVLTLEAVRRIADTLHTGSCLAAAPAMRMVLRYASWAVRAYYDIWQRLPYVREGMIGCGVYALSEQGRNRFSIFPDIIADDGYVRALFQSHERTIVPECWSIVRAPRDIAGLLKIKSRSRRGRYELASAFPELLDNEQKNYGNALLPLLTSIALWPKVAAYLYVNLYTRLLARKGRWGEDGILWERDESSRDAVQGQEAGVRRDDV